MAEREVTLDRTQIMKALRSLGRGETDMKMSKEKIAEKYRRRRERASKPASSA